MKTQFILTVAGPEHQRRLRLLSDTVIQHQGKFISSKLSHLEGQFTGLFKVEIPSEKEVAVKNAFLALEGITCQFNPLSEATFDPSQTITLSIDASDRPDILNDISHLLSDRDIRIKHADCHRYGVAELGKPLFSGIFELELPVDISPDDLVRELSKLNGAASVNFELAD
jgi:glycine cleavage system regulatory protein